MKIHYNKDLKQLARNLRTHGTLAEVVLWQHIRGRKMRGYQFMRQKPVGNYIVDFLCAHLQLVIEIDGESHADRDRQDADRQKKLEEQGFVVIRLGDRAVKTRTSSVVEGIYHWIEEWEQKQPPGFVPPARRERATAVTERAERRDNPLPPFGKGDLKRRDNPLPPLLTGI